MTNRLHVSTAAVALCLTSALAGCSLDVSNPNDPTANSALTTPDGIEAVTIGLQGIYGNSLEHSILLPGVVSGELGNTDRSFGTLRQFQKYPVATANVAIAPDNGDLETFWRTQYQVVHAADDILGNAGKVPFDPGTRSGITALAKTLKAAALGTLIEAWEKIPLDPSQAQPVFSDRDSVLTVALSLLESAKDDVTTTEVSEEFVDQVLVPGIDLLNTIRTLQARFSLAAGEYDDALAFANEVPTNAVSDFRYSNSDQNPDWLKTQSYGYLWGVAAWRTNAETGDRRVTSYVSTATATTPNYGGVPVVPLRLFATSTSPTSIFRQDELTLIRAEAYARTDRLSEAVTEINKVRTAAGLAAANPATADAALDEIFKQRTYSLYLTGLHWADERRFDHVADARAEWLPYPASEVANNPNAP